MISVILAIYFSFKHGEQHNALYLKKLYQDHKMLKHQIFDEIKHKYIIREANIKSFLLNHFSIYVMIRDNTTVIMRYVFFYNK